MTLEEQITKTTTSDQAGHQDVRLGSLLLRDLRSLRQRISVRTINSYERGLNMEVSPWECHCTAPRWACADCGGEGIFERWLPREDLPLMCTDYVMLSTQRMKRAA